MDWELVKITLFILIYTAVSAVIVWKAIGVSE